MLSRKEKGADQVLAVQKTWILFSHLPYKSEKITFLDTFFI